MNEKKYIKAIGKIQEDKISQELYRIKYEHLEIISYDTETFMPIYNGVPKWIKIK